MTPKSTAEALAAKRKKVIAGFVAGAVRNAHSYKDCTPPCPIHAPSDHHMNEWPINMRASGLVERMCKHEVGHPDPDSVAYWHYRTGDTGWGIHGCDGCCADPDAEPLEDRMQRAWDAL